jgi:hypothetical protein
VRQAYGDIGFELGHTQRFSSVAPDLTTVKSQFTRKWSTNKDCEKRNYNLDQCWAMVAKQEVITPSGLVGDSQLTKVYSSMSETVAKK